MSEMMGVIANTPTPPFYAVILTVVPGDDSEGYREMTNRLVTLAQTQAGFLGIESSQSSLGIIVSYWDSLTAIESWTHNTFHQSAKEIGKSTWYRHFRTRICEVKLQY